MMKSGPTFRQNSFDEPVNLVKSGSKYSRSKKSSLTRLNTANTDIFGTSMNINPSTKQAERFSTKKSRASRRVNMKSPASRKSGGSVRSVAKSKLGKSILTKHSRLNVSSSKKIGLGQEDRKSVNQSRGNYYPNSQDRLNVSSSKKIGLGQEDRKSVNQSRVSYYPNSQDKINTSN